MFIFNVYFGLEVLGDHSWFYLPITYATCYVYMFIEGSIPVTLTLAIYIIITLLLAVLLFKGFNKWSGRTIKDWGANGKRNLVAFKREEREQINMNTK
ncbi:truncated BsaG protein [Staphylococcus aureus]|nr:truncated BsaG protein [Staphylococcus aureus]